MKIRRMFKQAYFTPCHTPFIYSTKTERTTTPSYKTYHCSSQLHTNIAVFWAGWESTTDSCSLDGPPALIYSSTDKPYFNGKPLLLYPLLLFLISAALVIIICGCSPNSLHWATKGFVINAWLSDQLDRQE